jgi:succinoglycan biosynthesis protein ExoM
MTPNDPGVMTPAVHEIPVESEVRHITVCICTFRRPKLLSRLLWQLEAQRTRGRFTYSLVVVDNDAKRSAESVVATFSGKTRLRIRYSAEPRQNIAVARNRAIGQAEGQFVAFIDDDEVPESEWLSRMLETCEAYGAAGVLGPVVPEFEAGVPDWVIKGRFCERPAHATGRVMGWEESRTGNVLFRRSILDEGREAFRSEFGNGGEDKDFFMRMIEQGHVFRWCNEGVVHETVPPERWTRRYMLRRAMLRGRNILKHHVGRRRLIARSVVAVPVYLVTLPLALLLGQAVFMRCCVRLCDHGGRLLALCGLNPVRER